MGKFTRYSQSRVEATDTVWELRDKGMSMDSIAEVVDVSRATVKAILSRERPGKPLPLLSRELEELPRGIIRHDDL